MPFLYVQPALIENAFSTPAPTPSAYIILAEMYDIPPPLFGDGPGDTLSIIGSDLRVLTRPVRVLKDPKLTGLHLRGSLILNRGTSGKPPTNGLWSLF